MKKTKQILLGFAMLLLIIAGLKLYKRYDAYQQALSSLPDFPIVSGNKASHKGKFDDKAWIHKVNSAHRAVIVSKASKGMEIDVVFDTVSNAFDVNHPPAESIGLSLNTLFDSIPGVANHYFWLDFKNLDDNNKIESLKTLTEIAEQHGISPANIIVESQSPEALSEFTKKDFFTSYYLPVFKSGSKQETEKKYNEIKQHLLKSHVNALSANYIMYPFIQKYFPDMDVLLWQLDENKNLDFYITHIFLKTRSNVKVVLVCKKTEGYR